MPPEKSISPFDGASAEGDLNARVQVNIPIPSKEEILAALREHIPQVLRDEVHVAVTKFYAQGTFDTLVEEAAKGVFLNWLTAVDKSSGRNREDFILDRFHHFMTEEVAGPRTRQDYLVKVLLAAFPDVREKLLAAKIEKG